MHVLVVDDEYLTVEEIVQTVQWNELGIEKVSTANSLGHALKVMAQQPAEIILCDIEMPGGNGLELLKRVKADYPDTEVMLLTCHADFKYAREAVHLGSLDYLLKPVSFEDLKACLRRAIEKVSKAGALLEASRYGEYWNKHLPVMIERFWFDIINRTIEADVAAIRRVAELRNIPISDEMQFFPVVIILRRWHSTWDVQNQQSREFAFKNVARETILHEDARGLLIEINRSRIIILMTAVEPGQFDPNDLKGDCELFISTCSQYLDCDLNCYFGQISHAHEVADQIDRLVRIDQLNVSNENTVLSGDVPLARATTAQPDIMTWRVMLANGQFRQVFTEVVRFLNNQARPGLIDSDSLCAFRQDFMQILHAALMDQNIQLSTLMDGQESMQLDEQSLSSVPDLINWINRMDQVIDDYLNQDDDHLMVTQKATRYIKQNLNQELSRETIARHLFINQDYLDRLFKQELGESVTRYLLEERLKTACQLLASTVLSISLIAGESGFNSVRTFNRVFKSEMGLTPAAFRRTHAETVSESQKRNA